MRLQSLAEEGALVEFAEAPRPAVSRRALAALVKVKNPDAPAALRGEDGQW